MGESKEKFVIAAQARSKNAYAASEQAAFNMFKTSLVADQALFEAMKLRPWWE